jgi:CRP/FNR family transcriptional regulator
MCARQRLSTASPRAKLDQEHGLSHCLDHLEEPFFALNRIDTSQRLRDLGEEYHLLEDETVGPTDRPQRALLGIESGLLAAQSVSGSEKGLVLGFYFPGDLVAVGWPGEPCPTAVRALKDSVVHSFSGQTLRQIFQQQPLLGWSLFDAFCGSQVRQREALLTLVHAPVERRVALFFWHLGGRLGVQEGQALRVPLPMRRCDIASTLGLRSETFCRILSRWKALGLMTVDGLHEVCFPDMERLDSLRLGSSSRTEINPERTKTGC